MRDRAGDGRQTQGRGKEMVGRDGGPGCGQGSIMGDWATGRELPLQ